MMRSWRRGFPPARHLPGPTRAQGQRREQRLIPATVRIQGGVNLLEEESGAAVQGSENNDPNRGPEARERGGRKH